MADSVYVETSVISYLTSKASRDVVIAGRQQSTRDWWDTCSSIYELFISELVVEEAQRGDPQAVERRLQAVDGLSLLEVTDGAAALARDLVAYNAIPDRFPEDAMHIALAAINGMDYLLTWNFKHINNAALRGAIVDVIHAAGHECPTICTPEGLAGGGNAE